MRTPYDPGFVTNLKLQIPPTERRWDPAKKVWVVDPSHGQYVSNLCKQFFGEHVHVPKGNVKGQSPERRILEIRYLGMTKDRGDGERSAFGNSNGSWSVVFPEKVLTAWFSGTETKQAAQAITLYALLGLNNSCEESEIKKAFRRMARQWHPDICKEPNAHEMFINIKNAYDVLKDPVKRARYNAGLVLEASMERSKSGLEKLLSASDGYRAPLRCGYLIAEGIEKVGRFVVSRIIQWEDIKNAAGLTLVVSWPAGADTWEEQWV